MRDMFGSPGSVSGMILRVTQCACAGGSFWYMITALGFPGYSVFCLLIASMVVHAVWTFVLASLDFYALITKTDFKRKLFVAAITIGDWLNSFSSLATACSSAGVVVLYERDVRICSNTKVPIPCGRFEMAVALAFIAWLCSAISSLVMLALLASA